MAFCSKCGTQMADGVKFCPKCGNAAGGAQQPNQQQNQQQYQQQQYQQNAGAGFNNSYQKFTNTPDSTSQFNPQDIANNKSMAILAYIGILVLVPLFAAKESPYARYHANQGLILLILDVVLCIVAAILGAIFFAISWRLLFLSSLIWIIVSVIMLVLVIIGIMNAAGGKAKELPLIGKIRLIR